MKIYKLPPDLKFILAIAAGALIALPIWALILVILANL
jgi:hypothetical protein